MNINRWLRTQEWCTSISECEANLWKKKHSHQIDDSTNVHLKYALIILLKNVWKPKLKSCAKRRNKHQRDWITEPCLNFWNTKSYTHTHTRTYTKKIYPKHEWRMKTHELYLTCNIFAQFVRKTTLPMKKMSKVERKKVDPMHGSPLFALNVLTIWSM